MTAFPYYASTSEEAILWETQYGATNYEALPVVFSRGQGTKVWDPEGKEYLDFLSGICSVSQGHCHPKIGEALVTQARRLTLSSRAFYSDNFGAFAKYATDYFKYDRILMMNTGVEAFETAMKLCRKWGYETKKIAEGQAKIVFCEGNFHGRTLSAVSASSSAPKFFGPYLPNLVCIPFNDIPALEKTLSDPTVAAFFVEPIQGEGGVVVPKTGYLKAVAELCKKQNVLFVADEIQTGLGRTGKLLACDHDEVRPDVVLLGKALSGGTFPVSAVLADNAVMLTFKPGDHGSTFGGNPLACAVARAALDVIKEENLAANAERMGELFRQGLSDLKSPVVEVRGKGLLNAIIFNEGKAKDVCLKLIQKGLIAKNMRDNIIRFAPPLVIGEEDMRKAIGIIRSVLAL